MSLLVGPITTLICHNSALQEWSWLRAQLCSLTAEWNLLQMDIFPSARVPHPVYFGRVCETDLYWAWKWSWTKLWLSPGGTHCGWVGSAGGSASGPPGPCSGIRTRSKSIHGKKWSVLSSTPWPLCLFGKHSMYSKIKVLFQNCPKLKYWILDIILFISYLGLSSQCITSIVFCGS